MSSFDELVAATDRAVMAALGGALVTYTSSVGPPVQVTGMFDTNYVLVQGDGHAGVEALGPAVFFRLSDLPMDPIDEPDGMPTLTIHGNDYRVIERKPDDSGGIVLVVRTIT